jgi:hypothetical protein
MRLFTDKSSIEPELTKTEVAVDVILKAYISLDMVSRLKSICYIEY